MVLIVPNSFLNDTFSDGGMIKIINQHFNFICQFDLPSNSFKNVGVDSFETKIMIFQKKSEHLNEVAYSTFKIDIFEISENQANMIYNTYIKPAQQQKEKIKNKLFFENLHNEESEENKQFAFEVKKLLFDIKRNPNINKNYAKCYEDVNKYYTQKQPEGMKWEEWKQIRVTKKKVISYLKKNLKKQNEVEEDKIELVKTAYGLKLKGYSNKNKAYLNRYQGTKQMSFNDMIINENYPFEDKTYYNLYQKKLEAYKLQSKLFYEMEEDKNIKNFLDNLVITDYENNEEIRLNVITSYSIHYTKLYDS